MDANKIKEILSEVDILNLLESFGGEPERFNGGIVSRTICHNVAYEGSRKLVYYSESKKFHCYTGCGTFDVFGLIKHILKLEFYDAFKYLCIKFNISISQEIIDFNKVDISFIKKFNRRLDEIKLNILPHSILNSYYDIYHMLWLEDGISIRSMKKFNIKLAISANQIIIPHYDIDGNLIGVRARNLNQELINEGKKYMPVFYKNKVLKHATGCALYGLDRNKKMIEKYRTIILVEAEKGVLQIDTMYPERSIAVAISGSHLTDYQLEILRNLNIDNCIIALDKEFEEYGTDEEKFYARKIRATIINKLLPYFNVSIVYDIKGRLNLKDSPMDKGKEVFEQLMNERIFI